MKIVINKNDKTPLYLQIYGQVKDMIFKGTLVDGYPLPSERGLAKDLGIHRNTVIRAYSELRDEGLISSHQGISYRVSYGSLPCQKVRKPVNWEALVKEEYDSFESDFDDLFSKSYEAHLISFAGGVAAREPYSTAEIAAAFGRILKKKNNKPYFYTPYQGDKDLRGEIADFMSRKGIITKPGNIQIFSENNQALDFLLTLMLSPGDKVVVPDIMSPDVYRTVQLAGGEVITVPMDGEGMVCHNLEALLERERPRFIYVDSSFNNPTGVLLSLERRKRLLELSYKYRIPIIEEDEGSELYYRTKAIPSIKSMDTGNNILYMYSFSLTMIPGVGISFVITDREVASKLSKLVSARLVTLDWAPQMLMLEYMRSGLFMERLDAFRKVCGEKQNLMNRYLRRLRKNFAIEYALPAGGVYFWIKLPDGMEGKSLLAEAQKEGVAFIPGNAFYTKKSLGNNYIRLNYSYPTKEEIKEGMEKLEIAMRRTQELVHKKSKQLVL
ncbi:MAG: PLP-dependent aminotransferase family protein [Clostridiales bacterium]|nr:PLP-dependent aminotransferase family protein [Clostridiales bacterium]